MGKRFFSYSIVVILVIGLILGAVWVLPIYVAHENQKNVPVVIKKGSSVKNIAEVLETNDVIPSNMPFLLAAKLSERGKRLQSGVYQFPKKATVLEILNIVAEGSHQVEKWITITEGSSLKRIASLFQKHFQLDSARIMALCKDRKFISSLGLNTKSLEGYLLPDTYRFKITVTETEVVKHLAMQMKAITDKYSTRMDSLKMTKHEILTMASIVEGETRLDSERARVAGVYYNRLRIGMPLQADPTVQYIIPDGPRRLLYSDLRRDSRYNTYKYKGLPPGPINNPGRKAIHAACYPEKHKYFFFVADGTGGHIFSRNANEHAQAVAEYRRYQRSQRVN